jgi:peptide/nickel transport system permease protein
MRRPAGFVRLLRGVALRVVPGTGQFLLGRRLLGSMLMLWSLLFPVLLVARAETVWNSVRSLALTVFLAIADIGTGSSVYAAAAFPSWVAAAYLVAAPVALAVFSYRHYRRRLLAPMDTERSEWSLALSRFFAHRAAAWGLFLVGILYSVAFLAPLLAPLQPNSFETGTVTQYLPPCSTAEALQFKEDRSGSPDLRAGIARSSFPEALLALRRINRALTDDGTGSLLFVDAWHIESASVIATGGQNVETVRISDLVSDDPARFLTTRFYLLGTDSYGRDIFSRLVHGSRISLALGLIAVLLSVSLGSMVGLSAGYFGRVADRLLMRFVDMLLAFPTLFLILIIVSLFEHVPVPRILLIVSVLGFTSWMGVARLVRAEVLTVREREYVLAARAIGASTLSILLRHILPNILTPVIVNATLRIGGIILVEAALSFLNLGVQPPTASWGSMIYDGKDALSNAWWISTLPGLAIVVTVVSFNLIGDGLRDASDPTLASGRRT